MKSEKKKLFEIRYNVCKLMGFMQFLTPLPLWKELNVGLLLFIVVSLRFDIIISPKYSLCLISR